MLTAPQRKIMVFIQAYIARHGVAPTCREIGMIYGYSQANALRHLQNLEAKGFIRRLPRMARALEVLRPVPEIASDMPFS